MTDSSQSRMTNRASWQGLLSGLTLAVVSAGLPYSASAEVFTLQSGEVIKGEIVFASRNTLIIHREIGGVRQIPTADLAEVCIAAPRGEQMVGRFLGWEDGVYRLAVKDKVISLEDGILLTEDVPEQSKSPLLASGPAVEADRNSPAKLTSAKTESTPETVEQPVAETSIDVGAGGPEIELTAVQTEIPIALPEAVAAQPAEAKTGPVRLVIDATAEPIAEGGSEMIFSIRLSRAAAAPVALIYATVDGTATAGTDYEPQQGVLTLEPGTTFAELRAPLINDDLAEDDELFHLFLTTDPSVAQVSADRIVATIKDDD